MNQNPLGQFPTNPRRPAILKPSYSHRRPAAMLAAILTVSSLALTPAARANPTPEWSAREIVEKANQAAYYAGNDGRARVTMTLHDAAGGTRIREFSILRLNTANANQKFYVYFEAPADVRRMAYLVWKNVGANDDRWLWLPDLNLVRRIAPGDKRSSFVGSDFVYEDVSGRGLDEDRHELIETTANHYIIQSTPIDPASVEFASVRIWIDRTDFLPRKAEYLDRDGRLYRRVSATRIETIDGFPTVMESVAEDLRANTRTVNVFSDVGYNIGLNERIFTERFLRRPPREVNFQSAE